MKSETVDLTRVVDALEGLRQELVRLADRVAALEAGRSGTASDAPAPAVPFANVKSLDPVSTQAQPVAASELNEELILIIGAAIAAFLGKKAHIRQIRLIGSAAWAQQGRVLIQASHALSVHSPRS